MLSPRAVHGPLSAEHWAVPLLCLLACWVLGRLGARRLRGSTGRGLRPASPSKAPAPLLGSHGPAETGTLVVRGIKAVCCGGWRIISTLAFGRWAQPARAAVPVPLAQRVPSKTAAPRAEVARSREPKAWGRQASSPASSGADQDPQAWTRQASSPAMGPKAADEAAARRIRQLALFRQNSLELRQGAPPAF